MQFATIIEIASLLVPLLISTSKSLFKGKTKWVMVIVAYFILKKWAVSAAADKARSDLQTPGSTNPNALATLYKQAMNPSGYGFLIEMDGTSEDLIFQLAAATSDYRAVWEAYKKQYNRDMTDDLQKELSSEDYAKFVQILNS